jgi:hypothetical protein
MFRCSVMSVSPWMQPVLWWRVVVFQLQFWPKIWYKLLCSPQCIVLQIGLKHSLLFHYTPATWGCWGISITPPPSSRATRLMFQETMFAMPVRWCPAWAMFCALGEPGCTASLPDTHIGHVLCTRQPWCIATRPAWPAIGSTSTVACVVCLNYLQLKWPGAYWKQQAFRTNVLVPECSKVGLFLGTFFVFLDKRFGQFALSRIVRLILLVFLKSFTKFLISQN